MLDWMGFCNLKVSTIERTLFSQSHCHCCVSGHIICFLILKPSLKVIFHDNNSSASHTYAFNCSIIYKQINWKMAEKSSKYHSRSTLMEIIYEPDEQKSFGTNLFCGSSSGLKLRFRSSFTVAFHHVN